MKLDLIVYYVNAIESTQMCRGIFPTYVIRMLIHIFAWSGKCKYINWIRAEASRNRNTIHILSLTLMITSIFRVYILYQYYGISMDDKLAFIQFSTIAGDRKANHVSNIDIIGNRADGRVWCILCAYVIGLVIEYLHLSTYLRWIVICDSHKHYTKTCITSISFQSYCNHVAKSVCANMRRDERETPMGILLCSERKLLFFIYSARDICTRTLDYAI